MCGLAKAFPLGALGIASRLMHKSGVDKSLPKPIKAATKFISHGATAGVVSRSLFGD